MQFKKFQQGPENFIENLGNDPGGTGLGHRSGIEPDVSLSKIYVRDFEELASAFVRISRVRLARVRSLASDLLAWRESFLLKRSSVSFISKIRQENKDQ